MTKNDLQTGMVIEIRNGSRFLIMRMPDGNILASSNSSWMHINEHNEDLTCETDSLSVVKVFEPYTSTLARMVSTEYEPIWERKEPKKMTVEEICEALGYEVEIVK